MVTFHVYVTISIFPLMIWRRSFTLIKGNQPKSNIVLRTVADLPRIEYEVLCNSGNAAQFNIVSLH